jgi:NAD(P)-dependent dehydrogenase (short-subunit alcohol dehydrogenase family)
MRERTEMKLEGKLAIVTGGSQGIGKAIVESFVEEGADVVVNYIQATDKAEEVASWARSKGRRALVVQGDVSKPEDVGRIFEESRKLGIADILVNNAGIETIVPFLELTVEQWERVTNVNLKSAWMCSQAFCKLAVSEKRTGAIINVGSIQAGRVLPGRTHYAPTKIALEALTRNSSAEMGPYGIRINCIHPGLIATQMTEWVMKNPDILPVVVSQISLGRPGIPSDVGPVAVFFACEDSRYITGQSLYVDGGWVGK